MNSHYSGSTPPILSVENISVAFGESWVLKDLTLHISEGEILGFIGPSGAGKSVLMRTILGLTHKNSGVIKFYGQDIDAIAEKERRQIKANMGVLFQQGALFSSLTLLENIQMPMQQYLKLPPKLMEELAYVKISLVGLGKDSAHKYPNELSGGMIKRAALARALALDPKILFLDEPTAGLDPIGASEFDELIINLRNSLGLTVYMVTHDLDSLYTICDRIAILGNKRIKAQGALEELQKSVDPWIKAYFHGKRARHIPK